MKGAANYIALAIPVFFLLIGIELLVAKLQKSKFYRFNDAVTNISCGIGQQILGVFLKTLLALGYLYLYNNFRLLDLSADKWWVWLVCFLGVDFFYYWFHRYAHEISFLWGGHIVHHQSEEYNLSVALRQGAFQTSTSWVFYLPLAIIGFDPITFVVVNQFQTLYQFWIHTRTIGKMPGWFEFVFNTPSHHRVHHGINPVYIDRNHAGTLIIWDRMFGTFQAEKEPVVYGVTKALASWNPVWANFDYFVDVLKLAAKCRNFGDVVRVFVKKPGWRPAYLGGPQSPQPVRNDSRPKYGIPAPIGLNYYVLAQYFILLVTATVFLFTNAKFGNYFAGGWATFWKVGLAAWILLSIMSLGGLLDRKGWAPFVEAGRILLLVAGLTALLMGNPWLIWVIAGAVAYAIGSMVWLAQYQSWLTGANKNLA